jgi:hypothetical protein
MKLLELSLRVTRQRAEALHSKLANALEDGKIRLVMDTLDEFFAATSYDLAKDKEVYFQLIVHVIFRMLGFDNQVELRAAHARIDMVLATKKYIYLFEFKRDESAAEAMKQIEDNRYPKVLLERSRGRKIIKIGIRFNSTLKNIDDWISDPAVDQT